MTPGRDRLRVVTGLLAPLVAVASLAACGGNASGAVRIGVLTDCEGFFRANGDSMLRGAQVPFLQRGAVAAGPNPGDGVSSVTVGNRTVELVDGCVEGGEYTTMIRAARDLIVKDHVAAVVGGSWPGDGLVLRELARAYPEVAFVSANPGPREVTLIDTAPNLLRFAADGAQSAAGLGTYAADVEGWRRVAVVTTDRELGWQEEAAFLAEFCAAGGSVVAHTQVPWYLAADPQQLRDVVARPDIDGVVILGTPVSFPGQVLADTVASAGGTDHVLLGPEFSISRSDFAEFPASLNGVVGVSPWQPDGTALARYRAGYLDHFPGERDDSLNSSVVAMRDGVEAVLRGVALDQSEGATTGSLVDAMRHVTIDGVGGPTSLDDHGQAVATSRIVRLVSAAGALRTDEVATQAGVGQSLGGLLRPDFEPRSGGQDCALVQESPP